MDTLCIVGRYADWGDLDLEGTADDLRALALIIETSTTPTVLDLAVPAEAAAPYAGFLRTLRVTGMEQQVRIWRDGEILFIAGACSTRKFLAGDIRSVAETTDTNSGVQPHTHIEPIEWPGLYDWLSPSSEPLVVSLRL